MFGQDSLNRDEPPLVLSCEGVKVEERGCDGVTAEPEPE